MKRKKNKKLQSKKVLKKQSNLPPLKEGDLIQIIAPSSATSSENLAKGAAVLRSWGFEVQYADDLVKPELFLANSDEYRLASFKKAMTDKNVKAVWCLRGGYGAIRLLPDLEKMAKPKDQKLLIGFSDVTSLHNFINRKWGWASLHASLIDRLATNKLSEENLQELKSSLFDADFKAEFKNLTPLNSAAQKKKIIKAELVGGTLLVVASNIGTPSQINLKNKILFLEEISERAYRVDRCLQQMKQSGVLKDVKAVVFGDFVNCNEADGKDLIPETLKRFFQDLKIPAFSGLHVGHGEIQRPLYFNTQSILTCGENPQMVTYSPFSKQKS